MIILALLDDKELADNQHVQKLTADQRETIAAIDENQDNLFQVQLKNQIGIISHRLNDTGVKYFFIIL